MPVSAMRFEELLRHDAGHGAHAAHAPEVKGFDFNGGLLSTAGHGRTDNLPINIPAGSYVLPADIVSAIGQGNTLAGAHAIEEAVSGAPYHADGGPYGAAGPDITRGHGAPGGEFQHMPAPPPAMAPGAGTTTTETRPGHASGGRVKPRIYGAGIMIATDDRVPRVLFIRRSGANGDHAGEWCFPGGHIERGETPEDAARRETDEEIGARLTGLIEPWTRRVADGVDFTTFRAIVAAPFRPKLNAEHSSWTWAPAPAAPRPLHPGCRIALDKMAATPGGVERVPIIAAGGEYILPPHVVRWLGKGNLDRGHR
ncbi:MAG TPA: NUDIX domain-containing protein, partial [Acidiphilium sp.]|nr:NUDIX domain-containing protein [Acidiphilium sp.]